MTSKAGGRQWEWRTHPSLSFLSTFLPARMTVGMTIHPLALRIWHVGVESQEVGWVRALRQSLRNILFFLIKRIALNFSVGLLSFEESGVLLFLDIGRSYSEQSRGSAHFTAVVHTWWQLHSLIVIYLGNGAIWKPMLQQRPRALGITSGPQKYIRMSCMSLLV